MRKNNGKGRGRRRERGRVEKGRWKESVRVGKRKMEGERGVEVKPTKFCLGPNY